MVVVTDVFQLMVEVEMVEALAVDEAMVVVEDGAKALRNHSLWVYRVSLEI